MAKRFKLLYKSDIDSLLSQNNQFPVISESELLLSVTIAFNMIQQ